MKVIREDFTDGAIECPGCGWETDTLYLIEEVTNGMCASCFAAMLAKAAVEIVPAGGGGSRR